MQLGVGPHFLSHVAARKERTPTPQPPCVTRLSHTDSQTLAVLPIALPLAIRGLMHLLSQNHPSLGHLLW